ncbi:MAG: cation:dicarboxylase symporter family transporter [Bacteroidales bacterium]|nr:cation:dicarboxylase symporter family transporter [Bacteroidales bacterium]
MVEKKRKRNWTLLSLGVALILGSLLKWLLPTSSNEFLSEWVFSPIKTSFIFALKVTAVPVVFFSVMSCIAQFTDMRQLGRLGARTVGIFMATMLMGVAIGLALSPCLSVSEILTDMSAIVEIPAKNQSSTDVVTSLLMPFLRSYMVIILFVAILCGIGMALLGKRTARLLRTIVCCNRFFMRLITWVSYFLPLMVLCSICDVIVGVDLNMLGSMFSVVSTFLIGLVVLTVCWMAIMALATRQSPFAQCRAYVPTLFQTFALGSGNAALPLNMQACTRDLHLSEATTSFVLPLGTTLNTNASSMLLPLYTLFIAGTYHVALPISSIIIICVSTVLLCMAAPAVPAVSLVCLSVLLSQVGLPQEGLALIVGVEAVLGLFQAAFNMAGTIVAACVLDKKNY